MVVISYYFVRAIFIIFPSEREKTGFATAIEILQFLLNLYVCIMVGWSFKFESGIHFIKYLLFLQCIQMDLSNFNIYKAQSSEHSDGFVNFEGLNMLSSVFSVMFNIFNSMLIVLVFPDKLIKNILVCIVFVTQTFVLIYTNFIFEGISTHAVIALVIALVYTAILIPSFLYVTNAILKEAEDEALLSYQQRNKFKYMFDSLQQGIIVLEGEGI